MRKTIALLSATCTLGGAAVAQAKPVHYAGKTKYGNEVTFTVNHNRISKIRTEVPTECGAVDGSHRAGTSAVDPPGSFRIGHKRQVKAKRDNEMGMTSLVTKNFVLKSHRGKHGLVTVKAHVDYSFLEVQYTYPITAKSFVCTGDDSFSFFPAKH